MKTAVIVILSIVLFIGLLVGGVYAFFMYALWSKKKSQRIAENIQVTSDWLELKPEKPLKPEKQVQYVFLSIEGYKHKLEDNIGCNFGHIKLPDGISINPEVEIIDENGKTYHLKDSSRIGNNVGFSVNEKLYGTHSFAKDVTYTSVRIRSDNPFLCRIIYWYDYDMK